MKRRHAETQKMDSEHTNFAYTSAGSMSFCWLLMFVRANLIFVGYGTIEEHNKEWTRQLILGKEQQQDACFIMLFIPDYPGWDILILRVSSCVQSTESMPVDDLP